MLQKGLSQDVVAKKFNIWNGNEFFGALKKIPLEKIGSSLSHLAEIDYEAKTGRTTVQTAMETLVVQLAGK
jgi:DNA polymerase III delta subunit